MGLQAVLASLTRKEPLSPKEAAFSMAVSIARMGTCRVIKTCHLSDGGVEVEMKARKSGCQRLFEVRATHPQITSYRQLFEACEIAFLPPFIGIVADKKAAEPYPAMYLTATIGIAREVFKPLVEAGVLV